MPTPATGVFAPVVTPFRRDYRPDSGRLVAHCRRLLDRQVGLALFGTTSEANSLSVDERLELLDRILGAGIDPGRLMPGTGCTAFTDTARLTHASVRHGCMGVLMLPPFYYKGVSDEGLFRAYAEVIERVGDARLRIFLYHIPPVAQVGLGLGLIERLLKAYPGTIAGIKDSSGDWSNTKALLDAFAAEGFAVFVGSETFLLAAMRHGGAGCISASANVNPAAIHRLYAGWRSDAADGMQEEADRVRAIFQKYPMIAGLKQAIAHWSGDPEWVRLRPPLTELSQDQRRALIGELEAHGFATPWLRE
jgi:4-hydroxy-tetrahydrodipicolinate synthase